MENKHEKHFEEVTCKMTNEVSIRIGENINDIKKIINELAIHSIDCIECIEVAIDEGVSSDRIDLIMKKNREKLNVFNSLS